MITGPISTILWDLGGVFIKWNPDAIFQTLIPNVEERRWFLTTVCPPSWNEEQDRGRSIAEANAERIALFPDQRERIEAYYGRWEEMLLGEIDGTRALLADAKDAGLRSLALTNWSAETWPRGLSHFPWLETSFERVLVSGRERVKKPDPAIFNLAIERFSLDPSRTLFVDDVQKNVDGARSVGLLAHHFVGADAFRAHLISLGVALD